MIKKPTFSQFSKFSNISYMKAKAYLTSLNNNNTGNDVILRKKNNKILYTNETRVFKSKKKAKKLGNKNKSKKQNNKFHQNKPKIKIKTKPTIFDTKSSNKKKINKTVNSVNMANNDIISINNNNISNNDTNINKPNINSNNINIHKSNINSVIDMNKTSNNNGNSSPSSFNSIKIANSSTTLSELSHIKNGISVDIESNIKPNQQKKFSSVDDINKLYQQTKLGVLKEFNDLRKTILEEIDVKERKVLNELELFKRKATKSLLNNNINTINTHNLHENSVSDTLIIDFDDEKDHSPLLNNKTSINSVNINENNSDINLNINSNLTETNPIEKKQRNSKILWL